MDCRIVEGRENMRPEDIVRLLRTTYWAAERPAEVIERALQHSVCYGVFVEGSDVPVGFARVITDFATAYYLKDVVVDPAYRGRGLGKALLSYILSRPEYEGMRGLLFTRDAQDLYRRFGFRVINDRVMVKAPQ